MHLRIFIFTLLISIFSESISAQEIFFSEFTPDGSRSVVELFNPGSEAVDMSGYSVRLSFNGYDFPLSKTDNKYFDLTGFVLAPGETFVFAGKDSPEEIKLIADVVLNDGTDPGQYLLHFYNDDALGLFKYDELIDIIGKEGEMVVWDVAGVYAVTSHNTNGTKTIIRKPYIFSGNTDWDDARGFVNTENITLADSSEWLVYDSFYDNLKTHTFISLDSAVIWSDNYEISKSGYEKDTIYFVPLKYTGNNLLDDLLHIPGVKIDMFRESNPIDKNEILKQFDELVVWNADTTRSHTYVIWLGNYDYVKKSVIISEVLTSEMLKAIEIYNATSVDVDLTGWGIARDDSKSSGEADSYTAFPAGLVIEPNETFVIGYIKDTTTLVPSSNVKSYADFVLPYFDMFEKGAANLNVLSKLKSTSTLTLLDNNDRVIDRFQPGNVTAVIDGVISPFSMASLVRRPFISHGEPVWQTEKESQKSSSTWTWKPFTYLDLGKHTLLKSDTAFAESDFYIISSSGINDSIFPVKKSITCDEFLKRIKIQDSWNINIKKDGTIIHEEEPIPEGSILEVISTDLSFTKFYKLSFGRSELQISLSGVLIENDTVFCNDLYATSSQMLEKLSAPERGTIEMVNGLGTIRTGYLKYGDRILVTAEDLSQKYINISFNFPPGYSIIRSPFYVIDTLLNSISGIPDGENPELVASNIILAEGQNIEILNSEGQLSTSVKQGDIVRITASNGSARNYSVTTYSITTSKQVWDQPTRTTLPPGLQRSDVYLRSLRHSDQTNFPGPVNPESGKVWVPMDALSGFHCTQLRWVSSSAGAAGFTTMVQDAGFKYQGSVNPKGSLIKDDNYYEPVPGAIGDRVCPNKPGTYREYFGQLNRIIDLGSDGLSFHSDGARWLMDTDLDDILICYCEYCNAKRKKLGISNPASFDGKKFMLNSMLGLLDSVHFHFEDTLGQKIEWSGNNSSRHEQNDVIKAGYTTAYGEVNAREYYSTPAKWIRDFRTAEKNNMFQIFQLCAHDVDNDLKADDVLNIEQYDKFVCINRADYAFAYAAGGLASVPWDSYTGDLQTRHFGLLSEYADLSGFIRGVGPLLNGYESGYDFFRAKGLHVGASYIDTRFDDQNAPLTVEGNDNAAVFVRVKPDDEEAPIMIHLTEWFHIYEDNEYYKPYKFRTRNSYTLKIRRSAFFNGAPFSVKLLTPAPYVKEKHELSQLYANELLVSGEYRGINETDAYRNLVMEDYLDYSVEGEFVVIQIPVLPHYGILKIEKGLNKPAVLESSSYQICDNIIYIPGNVPVEVFLSGLGTSEEGVLQIRDSNGFSKYSGQVSDGDKLAVLNSDQSCKVYSLVSTINTSSLILKHNNTEVPSGAILKTGEINIQESKELTFTLINSDPVESLFPEIVSDNESMTIQCESKGIAPGDTMEFIIKISSSLIGKNYGTIKISGGQCNILPFNFSIDADIVSSDILVRFNAEELVDGSSADFGKARIGEELVRQFTLVNYGKGDLVVSEIFSPDDNLIISPQNLTLKHAQSAEVQIRVSISELNSKEAIIMLHSNSFGQDSLIRIRINSDGRAALLKILEGNSTINPGDTLNFGEVYLEENGIINLLIQNEGNEVLEIQEILNSGKDLSLSVTQSNLLPGAEKILTLTYSPETTESFIDSVRINSNSYPLENFTFFLKAEALSTGLAEGVIVSNVNAYPNPFLDYLFLENTDEFYQLRISNSTGMIIRIMEINNETRLELDTSGLAKGIYTVLLLGEKKTQVLKIAKE